jgi:hypothetical protein
LLMSLTISNQMSLSSVKFVISSTNYSFSIASVVSISTFFFGYFYLYNSASNIIENVFPWPGKILLSTSRDKFKKFIVTV